MVMGVGFWLGVAQGPSS